MERRYEVRRSSVDGDERVEQFDPLGGGAPLVVRFTTFPGLQVEYGRWARDAMPRCGCDACDEDVESLLVDLRLGVDAVVSGRFGEEVTGGRRPRLRSWTERGSRSVMLDPARRTELGEPTRIDWPPWIARSEGSASRDA